jgi:hypothetical protein
MTVIELYRHHFIQSDTILRINDIQIPHLVYKDKQYYELIDYFKKVYNIDVNYSSFESTEDYGVVLDVYTDKTLTKGQLCSIKDLINISIEYGADEDNPQGYSFMKLQIKIEQQTDL